jgi:hypothetical protein
MTGSIYLSFTTDSISGATEKGFVYNVITAKDLCECCVTTNIQTNNMQKTFAQKLK